MINNLKATALAAGVVVASVGMSAASTFQLVGTGLGTGGGGNYCGTGNSNNGFGNGTTNVCNVDGSPWIVKYDFSGGTWNITEFNSAFGSEDDFGGIAISDLGGGIWGFTYTPDSDDPGITAFSAKGSNNNNLYVWDGADPFFGGQQISFMFPQGNSNITFFDSNSGTAVVPLPAAGWMLLAGVGGLAAWGRRRRNAA